MRILIVEDEKEMAESLRRGLEAEGYAVDLAHDGHYGLQLALTDTYAAVILDLMLPGLSGFRVAEELRRSGGTTPVLVLTAKDGEFDTTEALDSGADDYVTKPFSYPILLARLRAMIRRGRRSLRGDEVRVGSLLIDTRRRSVVEGTRVIDVTAREYMLLTTLAQRAGDVMSKEELLLEVWPGDTEDVNLVEARISRLRRKLGAEATVRIETVRGAGYRLTCNRT